MNRIDADTWRSLDDEVRDALAAACRPHAAEYLRRALLWLRSWRLAEQQVLADAEAQGYRLVYVGLDSGYTPPRIKSYEVRDYRTGELIESRIGVGDEDLSPAMEALWAEHDDRLANAEVVADWGGIDGTRAGACIPPDPDASDLPCVDGTALLDLVCAASVNHQYVEVMADLTGWSVDEVLDITAEDTPAWMLA